MQVRVTFSNAFTKTMECAHWGSRRKPGGENTHSNPLSCASGKCNHMFRLTWLCSSVTLLAADGNGLLAASQLLPVDFESSLDFERFPESSSVSLVQASAVSFTHKVSKVAAWTVHANCKASILSRACGFASQLIAAKADAESFAIVIALVLVLTALLTVMLMGCLLFGGQLQSTQPFMLDHRRRYPHLASALPQTSGVTVQGSRNPSQKGPSDIVSVSSPGLRQTMPMGWPRHLPSAPSSCAHCETSAAQVTGPSSRYLCPELVLNHSDTFLTVDVDAMIAPEGSFDVLGQSRSPVLRIRVTRDRQVEIAMSDRSPPLASISDVAVMVSVGEDDTLFHVFGKDRRFFATMLRRSGGAYLLVREKEMLMKVDVEPKSRRLMLLGHDLQPVGWAARAASQGGDVMEVCVSAGVDAVIVLACVLGIARFRKERS